MSQGTTSLKLTIKPLHYLSGRGRQSFTCSKSIMETLEKYVSDAGLISFVSFEEISHFF